MSLDKDKDREVVDPSLPLISNVVSLSSVASSSSSLTPPRIADQHQASPSPTPSADSNNSGHNNNNNGSNNTRRATLRFKRGIEISFDVDQNGQPVTLNNHEPSSATSSSSSVMPSVSSEEPKQYHHIITTVL